MAYLKWLIPLTLFYLALTGNGEPLNWLLGLLLATAITALLRPQPAPIVWRRLPAAFWAGAHFLLTLLWDLLVSSLQVSRLILQREIRLQQGIMALSSGSSSDLVTSLSAKAITLTPGELVVEIDHNNTLYIHSLDIVAAAAHEPDAQKRRRQQLEKIVS